LTFILTLSLDKPSNSCTQSFALWIFSSKRLFAVCTGIRWTGHLHAEDSNTKGKVEILRLRPAHTAPHPKIARRPCQGSATLKRAISYPGGGLTSFQGDGGRASPCRRVGAFFARGAVASAQDTIPVVHRGVLFFVARFCQGHLPRLPGPIDFTPNATYHSC
jgi:hypothetical protein